MTTLRVTSRDTLEDTVIDGEMKQLLNDLNLAAAKGHQFMLASEPNGDPVLLEVKNITRVRVSGEDEDVAFIGRT